MHRSSLSALVLRLGDMRRKANSSSHVVKWLRDNKPIVVPWLLQRLPKTLSGSSLAVARQRVFQIIDRKSSRSFVSCSLLLPSLLDFPIRPALASAIRSQLSVQLPVGTSVHLLFKRLKAPSPKSLLVNSKVWSKSLDICEFPCTCDALCDELSVGRSQNGHVCCLLQNTAISSSIPAGFHSEGACVWSFAQFRDSLLRAVDTLHTKCAHVVPDVCVDLFDACEEIEHSYLISANIIPDG